MRAEFVLDYDVVTLEQPQKLYLMARFESGPAQVDRVRRSLNLSLVIDRSGSMAGAKIDYTKQAAQFMVQHLGTKDTLSIVLYNDRVDTLLMPETIQAKDLIIQQIAGIKVGGTTNLSSGWLEGCTLVAQNKNDEHINRVILMSDGLANRGVTDTGQLVAMAQQKQGEGISTTTMGMGDNFNEDLLTEMAHAGGGAYYFIESPESAPIIFNEELQGLLNVVGQNLTISIEPTDQVSGVRQLNAYPMHMDGKAYAFRLGDVFGDELKALMLELAVPALKDLGEQTIAMLRFEYDELLDAGSQHHSVEFPVMINVAPKGGQPVLAHPEVEESVLLLKAAQTRRDAVESADHGQFETAATTLRNMAEAIKKSRVDSPELQDEHSALIQQAEEMGSARYTDHVRKAMHTEAFYTMTSRHGETAAQRHRENTHRTQSMKTVSQDDEGRVKRREGETPSHVTWQDQSFPLDKDLLRIGRASQNEITITDKGVSRFHCQITRQGDRLMIEDLGSTNGTMMHGKMLAKPVPLSVGDVAYLCDAKLVFHDGSL